ncbi:inositol polyphosphate phosphatase [Vararia minispora EC-137]|uniref:Inositol polyphosphate phosphatase n=1 Tax=Vararia minispora EC-137 TaxID=1314806 RepID=A0ACB8QJM0_9AGAM|nr:inositol polyphosphate phosphatase [Vararia minispora EC-137]
MVSSSSSDGPATAETVVQVLSYNTALQALHGLPQDLVDWLEPSLDVSNFLSRHRSVDIFAVGFQELLPLHIGLSGFAGPVIDDRAALLKAQIEAHAPAKDSYTLVAKVVNVGVALLLYARDAGIARRIHDVQTAWTGTGPAYMGNKGAVAIRFRVEADDGSLGEVYTFVCAHLTAHAPKLASRLADYAHITRTLLFAPLPGRPAAARTTLYDTSHLFFLGDLNFRLQSPPQTDLPAALDALSEREALREHDQLTMERRKGTVFQGLHEGRFWEFKPTYKYALGEVDKYNLGRMPAWTDRVLYATYHDEANTPDEQTAVKNILYTSVPSYTFSDHKPIIALLLLPPPSPPPDGSVPTLRLPPSFHPTPDVLARPKRFLGRTLDRLIGLLWWALVVLGAGSAAIGVGNFVLGLGAGVWAWWRRRPA